MRGAVRQGPSRWAGWLVCGRGHGRRPGRSGGPHPLQSSTGPRWAPTEGGDECHALPGEPVEALVSQWGLTALAPAALPRSLEATARLEPDRQDRERLWHQRRARAA
ncbi:MAG: hypothetical protein AUI36_44910 [Cyanobacteria bacterium 13_1_40CM_2_61_4]|nr:MAG: hypothetical protein AUI36_44910 [Cyanobacteria bacterium 13_1_40CM_2_61_4]